ncbi:MAG: hypothetical protein KJ056_05085 [Acidimicrobiia bacterium]|nr:hypothetical protein [Acidimicrobiia bacterium]
MRRESIRWARRSLALGAAAAMLLAACGGGGGGNSKAEEPGGETAATSTSTTSGARGDCFTEPGKQKARVRFVNLYSDAKHPAAEIQVFQGAGFEDPCGKKLVTVPYGEASDYIDVTASDEEGDWDAVAYLGEPSDDTELVSQGATFEGGEQQTVVFFGGELRDGGQTRAGAVTTFAEKLPAGSEPSIAPQPGQAVIGFWAASLESVVEDNFWNAGVVGQGTCLVNTEGSSDIIGGTSLLTYAAAPGSPSVGLFPSDNKGCSGTPAIGPTTVDGEAGSMTLVLAYGNSPSDLKLIALPVED